MAANRRFGEGRRKLAVITLELPQSQEENLALGRWVERQIPGSQFNDFTTMAFFEKGKGVLAVALFHNFRETDRELVFAAVPKANWASRDLINMVLAWPFSVGCHRITCLARKDNKKVRKLLMQLGFKQEGKLRKADRDGSDVFIYGLLAHENKLARRTPVQRAA